MKKNIEAMPVSTLEEALNHYTKNAHYPLFVYEIQDTKTHVVAVRFLWGNYGSYGGLSKHETGKAVVHEYHYNNDAYILYEIKNENFQMVSIGLDAGGIGHGEDLDPFDGFRYTFNFAEGWFKTLELSLEEIVRMDEEITKPEIEMRYEERSVIKVR